MKTFETLYYPYFEPPIDWLLKNLLFFDKIKTIVPEDASYKPSNRLSEILEHIPNVFESVSPRKEEVEFRDDRIEKLENAFRLIKNEKHTDENMIRIYIDHISGGISLNNHTFMHNSKMTEKVIELLAQYGLIMPEKDNPVNELMNKKFSVVNKKAGNLIVANIANNMSISRNWDTITNEQLEYDFNISNNLSVSNTGGSEMMLANAIIELEIPAELSALNIKDFKNIREDYSDVKKEFHKAIKGISDINNLKKTVNYKEQIEKIDDILNEFQVEMGKYVKHQNRSQLGRLITIGIGATVGLVVTSIGGPIIGPASGALAKIIADNVIADSKFFNLKFEHPELLKLITGLRSDIRDKSKLGIILL